MDDFNNQGTISVGGNFHIIDNSQGGFMFFDQYPTDVLLKERPFRAENYVLEQRRKEKKHRPYYWVAGLFFIIAALAALIEGFPNAMSFMFGCVSIIIGISTHTSVAQPNAFQLEELAAINRISTILKQRRVE